MMRGLMAGLWKTRGDWHSGEIVRVVAAIVSFGGEVRL
jgi:hypothetical protein